MVGDGGVGDGDGGSGGGGVGDGGDGGGGDGGSSSSRRYGGGGGGGDMSIYNSYSHNGKVANFTPLDTHTNTYASATMRHVTIRVVQR